jgi:hypothetical protein
MSLTFARKRNQMKLTVTIQITAVEFRRLNSFEWAVLSLLNTFQADTPTIADATSQLCIGEPAFLATALESLRAVGALQPRTDEPRQLDLKDYELSEAGKIILREDGWESGEEENRTEDIAFDWPSLRFLSHRNGGENRDQKQDAPGLDEVQEKITMHRVQEWLNHNDKSRFWRVQNFYVTNIAG